MSEYAGYPRWLFEFTGAVSPALLEDPRVTTPWDEMKALIKAAKDQDDPDDSFHYVSLCMSGGGVEEIGSYTGGFMDVIRAIAEGIAEWESIKADGLDDFMVFEGNKLFRSSMPLVDFEMTGSVRRENDGTSIDDEIVAVEYRRLDGGGDGWIDMATIRLIVTGDNAGGWEEVT